ncbi:unnamed protein product [Hymenolepis diminuta]|uniref:Uncharacterized protein n=1 Tax=Hymenolepis diminuta TaxID=6216 RepID=A0A564YY10_HYMDI|nr:unnamed protein product [Hymenolepis diminuta]
MQTGDAEARWLEITLKAGWDIMLARQLYINLPEIDSNQESTAQDFSSMAKNTNEFLSEYMRYLLLNEPKSHYDILLRHFIFGFEQFSSLAREKKTHFIGKNGVSH